MLLGLFCLNVLSPQRFDKHHSKDFLNLAQKFLVGRIDTSDPSWKQDVEQQKTKKETTTEPPKEQQQQQLATLDSMLNANDFRVVAERAMPAAGWAYYDSGANSEATLRENQQVFERFWLRPRILIDVSQVDISTSLLGCRSRSPIYVTATALARLAHPDGEAAIVRACHRTHSIYMLPTLSSCSLDEMIAARGQGQV